MAKCSKCGFSMDERRPLPSRCPRCGTQTGVGAPPPFAGPKEPPGAPPEFGAGESPATTLFGVPSVDPDELTAPLGKPDSKVPPPPKLQPPPPSEASGPPEIRLDLSESSGDLFAEDALVDLPSPRQEPQTHNEFDPSKVGAAADALELDLPSEKPSPSQAPRPGPPPLSPSSFAPPSAPPTPKRPDPGGLDVADVPDLPRPDDDLDLPSPADFDLPTPANLKPPAAPSVDVAPPPAPNLDALDEGGELLTPVDFDLPTPADIDLPSPAGDLPTPAGMEVEPTSGEVQPADMDVEPANLGVEPANLDVEPAHIEVDLPGRARKAKGNDAAAPAVDPLEARRSPVPKPLPRRGISRGVIYGGLALVLVAGAAAAAVYAGVFDQGEGDGPPQQLPKPEDGAEGGVAKQGPTAEPTETFLANLRADTPASYAAAMHEAQQSGNQVAEAEATLLMHLRYGPDPANAERASTLVEAYAAETKPHVTRVVGLAALVGNELGKAEKLLTNDDDVRTRLYRGWLLLAQDKPAEAQSEAEAVLAEHDDDLAAHVLRYEALMGQDPVKAVEQVEEKIAEHADHPGLKEVAIKAGLKSGLLAEARRHAASIAPGKDALDPYRARLHALRGRTFAAVGDYTSALAAFDEAQEIAPKHHAVTLDKIRTLVDANELAQARAEIGVVVKELAQSKDKLHNDALLLQAKVSVASGEGDKALQQLGELQTLLPKDPRVPHLIGEAHAMKLAVEEAQKAYAAARELDPGFYEAAIGEARLLQNAREGAKAIKVLDEAREQMAELENASEAEAALSLAKARLFEEQGQATAALTALDQVLEAAPNHNDAQLARGLMRLRQGETEAGRSDLVAVYERTGGYPGLTGPLGRLFAREGNLDELERLVGDNAENPQAPVENKLVAARLRLEQDRIDDAKSLIEQVLSRKPNDWEAHLLLAQAMLDAGDAETALTEIERARPRHPVAELHLLKGQILEYNNRHDQAGPEYRRALELDPKLHEARMWYGRLLALDGANKAAIEELQQVVDATDDEFPRAWLNLGRAYRGLNEGDSALEHLRRATDLDPTLHEGFYLQGRIYADRNEHGRAVAALEKATVDDASAQWWYVNALMDLGRALAKAGRDEAAVAAYEKFLATAPENHAGRGEAERQVKNLSR